MLEIDLSTLRSTELRRLLDTTRERGQASLTYEILQEMEARRGRSARGRRGGEPRLISLELGDQLEADADADLESRSEPSAHAPYDAADDMHLPPPPEPQSWAAEPLTLDAQPFDPARNPKPKPPRAAGPPRRWPWAVLMLVIGLGVGGALGWNAALFAREPVAPPGPEFAAAAAPPPALTPAPPSVDQPPAATADDTTAPVASATDAPPQPTADIAAPPKAAPAPPAPAAAVAPAAPVAASPPPSRAEVARAPEPAQMAVAGAKGCAAQPTPADQAICADPRLQRLQGELRQAYAKALAAHQDRDLLREHQLAWRDDRSAIADPDELARLYEARIRKLNAATAEALQAQPR